MSSGVRSCWRWLAMFVGLALLMLLVLLFLAGRWLSDADTPLAADAIVVLAGAPERAMYAADLYRQHYANQVLVSRPAKENAQLLLEQLGIAQESQEQLNRRVLLKMGVPDARIRFFGDASLSTIDEAAALRAMSASDGARFLIVTSPYHVRRVKLVFARAFRDTHVVIAVVATPYEPDVAHWWRSQEGARNVLLEIAKVAFYLAGGRFTHVQNRAATPDVD